MTLACSRASVGVAARACRLSHPGRQRAFPLFRNRHPYKDWNMSLQLSLVLVCGVIALLYGGWLVEQLLALSPGTKEMQEIAAAIQEGARAYLNRQYTTVAAVGAVIFIAAFIVLGWQVAIGFLIG